MIYQKDSSKAEEFIHHEEILDTLEYAQNNKDNRVLIEQLIEKAALCKGLTHREAAILLECNQPDLIERIFHLAKEIKQKFYGNRIVMFAPLYLSNYCVNGCVYCPYHAKNKTIARKKLTQEEIRREVIALQDMGHKRLALEAGEHPSLNPIEYILESIQTIYSIRHKNGAIRRVNVNIAATTVENYRRLTRLPAPVRHPVSVSELFQDLQKLFPERYIHIEIPKKDRILQIDRTQIEQVLINLIKNAREACSKKNKPEIKIKMLPSISWQCLIVVDDNGDGMLPEIQDKIFVPFFTTKVSGSGIGLSLCKQIMNRHGGNIIVKSTVGKGSCFTLQFG